MIGVNVGLTLLGGRYRLDDHRDSTGAAHDPRSWVCINNKDEVRGASGLMTLQVLLFRTREAEVCALASMAFSHGHGRCQLPVVFLGLLIGFLAYGGEIHW